MMSPLRIVSILHPTQTCSALERRFELLPYVDATILAPADADYFSSSAAVRRVALQARGRGRALRFPSLATALTLLDPAIVHVQADPDTVLARQVTRLSAVKRRFGVVLETEVDGVDGAEWNLTASLRSRYVLAHTSAVVARTSGALTRLRQLGFRGVGVVAAGGQDASPLPSAQEARQSLGLSPDASLVLGWIGPADLRSGIIDVFEAMAACDDKIALVIVASGTAKQDLVDHADALEILDRICIVPSRPAAAGHVSGPTLARQPALAGAMSALLLGHPRDRSDRTVAVRNIEFAQVHGVPVIYQQDPVFGEIVGPGGWAIPPADPALLARLLRTLVRLPSLVADASAAATRHAARRHSAEAAAEDFDRALQAVTAHQAGLRAKADTQVTLGKLRLAFHREPSRT